MEKQLIELKGDLMDLAGSSDDPDGTLQFLFNTAEQIAQQSFSEKASIEAMIEGICCAMRLYLESLSSSSSSL